MQPPFRPAPTVILFHSLQAARVPWSFARSRTNTTNGATGLSVATSAAGDHRFDARLTDYSRPGAPTPSARERPAHARGLLATDGWSKEDRIDLVLFQRSSRRGSSSAAD